MLVKRKPSFSKCKGVKFCLDDDMMSCFLVIEELVSRVVEAAEKDSTSSNGTAFSTQSHATSPCQSRVPRKDVTWQDPVPCRCVKPAEGTGADVGNYCAQSQMDCKDATMISAAINRPTDSITSHGNRTPSDDYSILNYFPANEATSSANNSYGLDISSNEETNSAGNSSGIEYHQMEKKFQATAEVM